MENGTSPQNGNAMLYAESAASDAERNRRVLISRGLLNNEYPVKRKAERVYFPLVSLNEKDKKLIESKGLRLVRMKGAKAGQRRQGHAAKIRGLLDDKERGMLARGFDQYGSIAVIDIEDALRAKEKLVAQAIMDSNGSIKTVIAKAGPVHGVYRTRDYRYVAGLRTFAAEHRENGCMFRFDVRKAFFSNRLAFERARVRSLCRPKESVMVMFAGVGPFAIEIAKEHKDSKVVAVELNRAAYTYMLENIKINKTPNVAALCSDVKKLPGEYDGTADRIIMPLPQKSLEFLDDAFRISRNGATVHLYLFGPKETALSDARKTIRAHASMNGYKVRFLFSRDVRPYSAKEVEIVVDFRVTRSPSRRAESRRKIVINRLHT